MAGDDVTARQYLQGCPDGGACHHECLDRCWRVGNTGPLAVYGAGDSWPLEVLDKHAPERAEQTRTRAAEALRAAGLGGDQRAAMDTWTEEELRTTEPTEPGVGVVVCMTCGRTADRAAGPDCEDDSWHQRAEAEPPPPGGMDLARALVLSQGSRLQHLDEELRSVWRTLHAVVAAVGRVTLTEDGQEQREVRVSLDTLMDATMRDAPAVLTSWCDERTRELVLQVRP